MQPGRAFGVDWESTPQRSSHTAGSYVDFYRRTGRHRDGAAKVGHNGVGQLLRFVVVRLQPISTLFPYTTLFRSAAIGLQRAGVVDAAAAVDRQQPAS